jgi:hypothetical protein
MLFAGCGSISVRNCYINISILKSIFKNFTVHWKININLCKYLTMSSCMLACNRTQAYKHTFKHRFEVLIALLLNVQVFETVTLCCWVSCLLLFEGLQGVWNVGNLSPSDAVSCSRWRESLQQLLRINALYYILWSPEFYIGSEDLVVLQ